MSFSKKQEKTILIVIGSVFVIIAVAVAYKLSELL